MTVRLLEGHASDVLAGLQAGTSTCACTSPPYAWLRSYNTEPQVWETGNACACLAPGGPGKHAWGEEGRVSLRDWSRASRPRRATRSTGSAPRCNPGADLCAHCGAWRGELGQEPHLELYVDHLVAVFRSVKRVLRDDGTLWVNLAGCYYNDPGGQNGAPATSAMGKALPEAGGGGHLKDLHASPRRR